MTLIFYQFQIGFNKLQIGYYPIIGIVLILFLKLIIPNLKFAEEKIMWMYLNYKGL